MAWMRMMGADSVRYHGETLIWRLDDHPRQAMAYYASRGETPLVWGGEGARVLRLAGPVTAEAYAAVFGEGGARHPDSGQRLVAAHRPGMELVISAHKSVAELGVIGRAEQMHQIMDAERDATLAYLDRVTRQMGGRRGRAATPTVTGGLVYAHTRHATSRAGDPCPHDHVLLANVVEMRDERGGWKAADTALWREHLHAATMIGRAASAATAVELGYGIEADPGPSGRLGHWRIAGVPDAVVEMHSKRAKQITAECERRGDTSYRARSVAARTTRRPKNHDNLEAQLMQRWQAELDSIGWPVERLAAAIDQAAATRPSARRPDLRQVRHILSEVLAPDGDLARRKVFARRDVIVALAHYLYGLDPRLVELLAARVLADPEAIPLVGVAGAREQPHALASVVARETTIADSLGRQVARRDAPALERPALEQAIATVETQLGGSLSSEQRQAIAAICTSGCGAELVVGVAGAGKTTLLAVIAAGFTGAGHQVVGTATSGQAARTLGVEARIESSSTLASLTWRLDHRQLILDERSVVICDEVGMTDDIALARLTAHVEASKAKLILVGDHRQLAAVGPGGALQALVSRHPDAVHKLVDNRRQADPEERRALAELRAGDVTAAVDWYHQHGRIHPHPDRDACLQATVDAWVADTAIGADTAMYAWRRANVAKLNYRARTWMADTGRLHGPELVCPGGRAYRAGDRIITLAPTTDRTLVTSQRGLVEHVDLETGTLVIRTDDSRTVSLASEDTSAKRLDHAYATTAHRAQGATVERAHLYADGGGRELAYVAMSRARTTTQVWTVADNPAQAVDDLRRDWNTQKAPTWAIDLATPAKPTPSDPHRADHAKQLALTKARIDHAGHAITAVHGPDLSPAIAATKADLADATAAKAELANGTGRYTQTDIGQDTLDLAHARTARQRAERAAQHAPHRRDRRRAAKQVDRWATQETDAQQRQQQHTVPELARLDRRIDTAQDTISRFKHQQQRYQTARRELDDRSDTLGGYSSQLAARLSRYRDHLDIVLQPAVSKPLLPYHQLARTLRPQHGQQPHPTIPRSPPHHGVGL